MHSFLRFANRRGQFGAILSSIINSLDLIEGDGVVASIVQTGCAGGLVTGHLPRDLELSAVLQVRRDAGRSKTVSADLRPDAGGRRAALNHHVDVGLGQGSVRNRRSRQRKNRRSNTTSVVLVGAEPTARGIL